MLPAPAAGVHRRPAIPAARVLPWLLLPAGVCVYLARHLLGPAAAQGAAGPGTVVAALLLVGGCLALLPMALQRWQRRAVAGGRAAIEIVDLRPVGGRRSVILLEVDGERVLVGSSESGLSLLLRMDRGARGAVRQGAERDR